MDVRLMNKRNFDLSQSCGTWYIVFQQLFKISTLGRVGRCADPRGAYTIPFLSVMSSGYELSGMPNTQAPGQQQPFHLFAMPVEALYQTCLYLQHQYQSSQ